MSEDVWRLYDRTWPFLEALRKAQSVVPILQQARDSDPGNTSHEDLNGGPHLCSYQLPVMQFAPTLNPNPICTAVLMRLRILLLSFPTSKTWMLGR